VDGIEISLLGAELEHLSEVLFAVLELQTQVPGAVRPAKDGVSLSLHPGLVIWCDSRTCDTLEHHLRAVRQRYGDQRRLPAGGKRGEAGMEEVAQVPSVVGSEGAESERITILLQRLELHTP